MFRHLGNGPIFVNVHITYPNMVSNILSVLALATAVLAHPQRHHRFHYGTGTGSGSGIALPTGGTFPANGTAHTNGTDFGGSAVESTATAFKTVTVSPVPLESSTVNAADAISSVPVANAAVSNTAVAAAGGSTSSCTSSSTSTITTTSVQFVTYTAEASAVETAPSTEDAAVSSDIALATAATVADTGLDALTASNPISLAASTVAAGAFFGRPSKGAGASVASYGADTTVQSVVPTTFATVAASAGVSASSPVSSGVASVSASSPVSSSSSTPSTGGSTSGKKGLSYNDASLTSAFAGKAISWVYNWGAGPDGSFLSGAEYVPMLWGLSSTSAWADAAAKAIASGSKHALSFNEPDLGSQANIDPQTAATNHIKYMNPLAGQVEIGSPAVTNGAGTNPLMGIDWLNAFFKACAGQCKVDFVAFHWYAEASSFSNFQSHVQDVINAASANGVDKVWLTEFGASGSDSEVADFLKQAVEFLDTTPAVERYAYFMCSDGILVNGNSIASPIGTAYA